MQRILLIYSSITLPFLFSFNHSLRRSFRTADLFKFCCFMILSNSKRSSMLIENVVDTFKLLPSICLYFFNAACPKKFPYLFNTNYLFIVYLIIVYLFRFSAIAAFLDNPLRLSALRQPLKILADKLTNNKEQVIIHTVDNIRKTIHNSN